MTYCNCCLALILLATLVISPPSMYAQEAEAPETITTQKFRERYIDGADKALHSANEDMLAKMDKVANPFEVYVPETPAEDPQTELPEFAPFDPTPSPGKIAPVSDQEALRKLAPRITQKVKGTIVMGSQSFLLTTDGHRIPLGTEISGTVRGEDYVVVVHEITISDYTLRLNDAEFTASLLESRSDAIQFDRN